MQGAMGRLLDAGTDDLALSPFMVFEIEDLMNHEKPVNLYLVISPADLDMELSAIPQLPQIQKTCGYPLQKYLVVLHQHHSRLVLQNQIFNLDAGNNINV
ncbi:MAG: hypothetical protein LBD82_08405, partial [Deltaproteobacteria bacterium]|nr:hypothetical protein [Deltaproteobacteria bacterium]